MSVDMIEIDAARPRYASASPLWPEGTVRVNPSLISLVRTVNDGKTGIWISPRDVNLAPSLETEESLESLLARLSHVGRESLLARLSHVRRDGGKLRQDE
jgi:hypothetical protein